MRRSHVTVTALLCVHLILAGSGAYAKLQFEVGTGAVFSGYNDVRAPNASGTDISFSEELGTEPDYFVKVRFTYSSQGHNIEILAAPLRLEASGEVNKSVKFGEEEFSANIPLRAVYKYDSYCLTYRYNLIRTRRLQVGLGLTARVEDGSITLEGGGRKSEKENLNLGPLINFRAQWLLSEKANLVIEGNAFELSQRRAEDITFTIQYKLGRNLDVYLGYRMLEGGVNVDELYNFRLLNYAVISPTLTF